MTTNNDVKELQDIQHSLELQKSSGEITEREYKKRLREAQMDLSHGGKYMIGYPYPYE